MVPRTKILADTVPLPTPVAVIRGAVEGALNGAAQRNDPAGRPLLVIVDHSDQVVSAERASEPLEGDFPVNTTVWPLGNDSFRAFTSKEMLSSGAEAGDGARHGRAMGFGMKMAESAVGMDHIEEVTVLRGPSVAGLAPNNVIWVRLKPGAKHSKEFRLLGRASSRQ
ncbi:hypothetical protein BH20GEM2_BH20GEM2_13190 [soil metagenome]